MAATDKLQGISYEERDKIENALNQIMEKLAEDLGSPLILRSSTSLPDSGPLHDFYVMAHTKFQTNYNKLIEAGLDLGGVPDFMVYVAKDTGCALVWFLTIDHYVVIHKPELSDENSQPSGRTLH